MPETPLSEERVEELKARLRKYEELGPLSNLPIHPETTGYTTGGVYGDAREAIRVIDALLAERDLAIKTARSLYELTMTPDHGWGSEDYDLQRVCGERLAKLDGLAPAGGATQEGK